MCSSGLGWQVAVGEGLLALAIQPITSEPFLAHRFKFYVKTAKFDLQVAKRLKAS